MYAYVCIFSYPDINMCIHTYLALLQESQIIRFAPLHFHIQIFIYIYFVLSRYTYVVALVTYGVALVTCGVALVTCV